MANGKQLISGMDEEWLGLYRHLDESVILLTKARIKGSMVMEDFKKLKEHSMIARSIMVRIEVEIRNQSNAT